MQPPPHDLSSIEQLVHVSPALASAHVTAATNRIPRLGCSVLSPFRQRLTAFAKALKLEKGSDETLFTLPPPPPMDAALLPSDLLSVGCVMCDPWQQ